jgi:DNA polymerase III subunit epsilon
MTQLSLEFNTPEEPACPTADPVLQASLTPQEMAERLNAHPDYRVLRRLVPVADYGPPDRCHEGDAPLVRRVLVLDTETTGLSHSSDRIIELAMLLVDVDVRTGRPFGPVETFEGFEDPGMPIPEIAQQVTGITDDMVRGHQLDDARVQALVSAADLVIAHNAGFDRPFAESRFPCFAQRPWACSFAEIDWKAQGAESARLGALALERGWFYDAHRALVDCHALLQVLCCPLSGAGGTGLGRLLDAAAQPGFRLSATAAPFESKDRLKARGYRWSSDARVWYCVLGSESALQAELAWLRAEVYGDRQVRLDVEVQDALTRYSARTGRIEHRALA